MIIWRDREIVKEAQYVLIETTYGDRTHDSIDNIESKLSEVVNRTYKRGGKLIIPSFSVGRTQQVVYFLNRLTKKNKIPKIQLLKSIQNIQRQLSYKTR